MKMPSFPFVTTDWNSVSATEHPGETGIALSRTMHVGEIRVRMVEYSAGCLADHWCSKGHVLLCLEGELETELRDGRKFVVGCGNELSGWAWGAGAPVEDEGRGEVVYCGLGHLNRIEDHAGEGARAPRLFRDGGFFAFGAQDAID